MNQLKAVTARTAREPMVLTLVVLASAAWWATAMLDAKMRAGMSGMAVSMSLGAFLVVWALMMAAMMLPAVTPVVRLYQRAAAAGRVAPTGWFLSAYLAVWTSTGLPAYLLWESLAGPLEDGRTWVVRLAGGTLLLAGAYQLTPLKHACLRHCQSPMSYFLRLRTTLHRPTGAFRAGLLHAAYCCGCCAALMVVLVATAAMNLWWAALIAVAVFAERNLRHGTELATGTGAGLSALGAAVLLHPPILVALI